MERLTHAGGIHDIRAVAWRPNAKDTLAVAHSGGVCIWSCEQALASPSGAGLSTVLSSFNVVADAEQCSR